MTRTWLGIDAGTSVVKAALFDDEGEALAVAGRPLELVHAADDGVEQDLDAIVAAIGDVTREVSAGQTPHVVAITGQGDGCWVTDEAGRAVRPALSWLDGRAGGILGRWNAEGVTERVFRVNGTTVFPGAPGPLLAWLDEHEPDVLDRATTAGACKDAVFTRLTGERATDPSDSSMPFGDGTGIGYSDTALEAMGLTHRRDLLAPITVPVPRGELSDAGAALLGLPAGTPISSGPFDFPACARGGGLRAIGDALLIVGTTLGCMVHVDRLATEGDPAGFSVATGEPGRWLRAMPAMVGTASMDWMLQTLGLGVDAIDAALATSAPGAGGVEVLPYFATSGERAPFVDPHASGQVTGVRLTTTRDDLLRAVCEGLAYAARHCFDAAGGATRIVACGGGTRSRPWLQVFADVLGVPLELARTPEVGARGAVLAAAAARGEDLDVETWTAPEDVVEPDPARHAFYADGYARYLDHVKAARPFWATRQASAAVAR
ncbi:xylulokinase/erythritol kinase [Pseudonocardia hierapolitana]|uniref:Xylulokinase/erythritol kinase n=1 Tax=Pseudonocardia hierapolitana TaxID=1128676 RepID=A0A561SIM5_9PSEU|nr:FGGY-family carbohydrate kinase [Pseudonocardia hierapolitana]TWF74717.1 xylulokinase/erythritol kinase [Pseudonocardia hierapolitana]